MPKPINLPLAKVVKAARKAYDAKRLSAQGPTPECAYRDRSGRPCVIGAALSAGTARVFDTLGDSAVADLVDVGRVRTDALPVLEELQSLHDAWTNGGSEAAFVAALKAAEKMVAEAEAA